MQLEDIENPDFWRSVLADFGISEHPFRCCEGVGYRCAAADEQRLRLQMIEDGYFQTPVLLPSERVTRLREAVLELDRQGIMPLFLAMYDEYWQTLYGLRDTFGVLLQPGYRLIPDFWIWLVEADDAASGWSPHRDGSMSDDSIRADGTPTTCTVWIALSDVETSNACMYVLPRRHDAIFQDFVRRKFGQPGIPDANKIPMPMNRIRALPVKAGAALGWDTNLLHWGSGSSKWASGPRISAGVYYQSTDSAQSNFPPYDEDGRCSVDCTPDATLGFEHRLHILANIINTYMSKFDNDGEREKHMSPVIREFCRRWRMMPEQVSNPV